METTGVKPKVLALEACWSRCSRPRARASRAWAGGSSVFPSSPPWARRARAVTTSTTALGQSPETRHLMSKNFSAPRSKPKPASVMAYSPRARAAPVATMLLQPWAMFPKGPPCTKAGTPSVVCTRLGRMASCRREAMAPVAFRLPAVTGLPSRSKPTRIRPSRAFRSGRSLARQSTAMTSEAAVMSKPSSRGTPLARPPNPITMRRRKRSFMSITRRQRIWRCSRSMPPWKLISLSRRAASRLWALVTACLSPVKCMLMRLEGWSMHCPPPVPPPFMPKMGPREGSRRARQGFRPIRLRPWARPMEVVVLPSPNLVGLMAETRMSLPFGGWA